jgi:hypothetical protein
LRHVHFVFNSHRIHDGKIFIGVVLVVYSQLSVRQEEPKELEVDSLVAAAKISVS